MLDDFLADRIPAIDYEHIAHKPGIATRTASADVLKVLGQKSRI